MANEGLIDRAEALMRVGTDQVDVLLHPSFNAEAKQAAAKRGDLITTGLNASPGAGDGRRRL